jgi:hypothetical protein
LQYRKAGTALRKTVFQVGDVVHNRVTKEQGKVVRVYADLLPAKGRKSPIAYIVSLSNNEVLWPEADVDSLPENR